MMGDGNPVYLTPCVPLSCQGEGEVIEEGLMPLLNAPLVAVGLNSYGISSG